MFFSSFLLVSIPNLIWNMLNNFSTINHLSSNAVIDSPRYSLSGSLDFIISQVGVIGPIMFIVSILAICNMLKLKDNFRLLICFVLPVFIIMAIQGFFSEANANWTATALPGLSIICGHYLAKNLKVAFFAIVTNSLICLLIYLISLTGNLAAIYSFRISYSLSVKMAFLLGSDWAALSCPRLAGPGEGNTSWDFLGLAGV